MVILQFLPITKRSKALIIIFALKILIVQAAFEANVVPQIHTSLRMIDDITVVISNSNKRELILYGWKTF